MKTLGKAELPYKLFKSGKVRDVFEVDGRLLIVSSDRISAFDYVLPSLIPGKGQILNRIAGFWFARTQNLIPNHVISTEPEKLLEFAAQADILEKRSLLAKKLDAFPIEAIVRAYIVGSGWNTYQKTGTICGVKLPPGLKFADSLPEPIFTPTTKADTGHDENITSEQMADQLGEETAAEIKSLSLRLFAAASAYALEKGIIIADSKFEFGRDDKGNVVLIDEIFTPDSSRFWKRDDYRPGQEPPPFDKQFVRNFLLGSSWDRKSPPPQLPADVIVSTTEKYGEIFRILTGQEP
ncbi:MAG: phosphoribosylaminoimidazolesuccinocarboxamide synthase [Acidobacteria bacterium]|nr:phosphoribosylaminoimidazolesuccinocarboxamide synthase [Acidobacteriota bacterium]MBU4306866.1 phosphoribosylaminoimidazolesuccinocarboxamide synthase [Acidobacteriota bacterium]MCG2810188.1 phosphoribosylaminoimidazolesuccinocarboxamide synthase [Candidatus Aminicenantes bacterium]